MEAMQKNQTDLNFTPGGEKSGSGMLRSGAGIAIIE